MKSTSTALIIGLIFLISGCVFTWHPLYTDQDLVFDEGLLGTWAQEGSDETWTFTRGRAGLFSTKAPNRYTFVYSEGEGKVGRFKAHLLRIKDELYLDLLPEQPEGIQNDFYLAHLQPVHSFLWVRQIGTELRLVSANPEWFEKYLLEHPDDLEHIKRNDEFVITAPTETLQAFLAEHTRIGEAFDEEAVLARVKNSE